MISLLQEPEMQLLLIQEDGASIGFIILWELDSLFYIQHLVIEPMLQCEGYGSKLISQLIKNRRRLIFETSFPKDDLTIRRLQFYEWLNIFNKVRMDNFFMVHTERHMHQLRIFIMGYMVINLNPAFT